MNCNDGLCEQEIPSYTEDSDDGLPIQQEDEPGKDFGHSQVKKGRAIYTIVFQKPRKFGRMMMQRNK